MGKFWLLLGFFALIAVFVVVFFFFPLEPGSVGLEGERALSAFGKKIVAG